MSPPESCKGASCVSGGGDSSSQEIHYEGDEEVVITGMSARLPESRNIYEFRDNLMNKVDMITEDDRRWSIDHPEIPRRVGKVENLSKFDASFFAVHYKQAHTMDPMCRILMELAFEAIVDAGVNPTSLRGTKTGCFIGACFSESEKIWFYERIQMHGFGITGCSRAMLANRISYWLDIHGPSYSVDTACSSSMYALDHALHAIRSGQCDAALVGGCNLTLHPFISLQFSRLGVLAPDGKCKSFDADADGYCRSEGLAVIFLQKAKHAKRIYATVVHTKTNCDGFKEQGITYPSGHQQGELLREFYEECRIPPQSLSFLEAHGTGTKVGDPEELNTIDRIFCPGRKEPLLVGSVKSNIGHSEPASAISAVIKVVVGMETGLIPPNLHFKNPRPGVPALAENRIKVVSEPTPWNGGLVGVSSFGFGGANAHCLLRSNSRKKPAKDPSEEDGLPRLAVTSGRTEEAVQTILQEFESRPLDSEYVALLQSVHATPIPGHIYRGYSVLHAGQHEAPPDAPRLRDVQYFPGAKRPVWFVFAGMGSQWAGMGRDLMQLPVFARAIDRCDAVLKPRGLDIKDIITNPDPKLFDNILNSFVGIAAIQVGLVDVLTEAGIVPDGIVGHSVGELGCAYADGCFTPEQMVLAAYSRGLASIETPLIHGSMAAVGLSHEAAAPLCPTDIEVACHNGTDSSTISGPADSVAKFVAELKERGIFAREVACSNIAYHSRYIAEAGPRLMKYLKQVIPEARARSERWVSSSVPQNKWDQASAKVSSAEYHTNNLLCPVLFAEALKHLPKDAITIEIAPHGLLQAILRRTLSKECTNVALTQRGAKNGLDVLFAAFGKLYVAGLQPDVQKLHPPVSFPVSRGTPMLSPFIRWQHQDDWHVAVYKNEEKLETGERTVTINVKEDEDDFYTGHIIDGRNLFPATGYLVLAWETLAMMQSKIFTDLPIVFENVKFQRACHLPKDGSVDLTIMVTKGTGTFEVVEGGTAVVTGRLYTPEDVSKELLDLPPPHVETTPLTPPPLNDNDVYKELRLRGYNYTGIFRAVQSVDSSSKLIVGGCATVAQVRWHNNYVAFMDAMLQTQILQTDSRSLYVPTALERLVVDPHRHQQQIADLTSRVVDFPVHVHRAHELLHSGGIEIRGLQTSVIARRKLGADPVLEAYQIMPYRTQDPMPFLTALRILVHIVLENVYTTKPRVIEWVAPIEGDLERLLSPKLPVIFGDLPLTTGNISVVGANQNLAEGIGALPEGGVVVEEKTKLNAEMAANLVMAGDGGSLLALRDIAVEALSAVAPGGFFLVHVRRGTERAAEQAIEGMGAAVTAVMLVEPLERDEEADDEEFQTIDEDEEEGVFILARKVEQAAIPSGTPKSSSPVSATVRVAEGNNELEFTWLSELQEVLKSDPPPHRVYLVCQGEPRSGILGLVNCLRKENLHNMVRCVVVLDPEAPDFNPEDPFYVPQLRGDLMINILPGEGMGWCSYRHTLLTSETESVTHAYVNVLTRGDLSSFRWLQGPIRSLKDTQQDGKQLFHIYYSALNFRDVMTATGKLAVEVIAKDRLSQDCVQGLEFSGRDTNGKRIMGLVNSGALANLVLADPLLVWEIPADWTMEEAATVPAVYCTVYYALVVRGRLRAGESVLIHAASGGVGQAALHVVLHMGCTVYVTVGTPEKREFIKKVFPSIPDSHIGNSRDTSFEQLVKEQTNGKGVDLVLNSLAGDKLQASLRCLGMHGRFLEIGKVDMAADSALGMHVLLKDVAIHGVLLDSIIEGTEHEKRRLREVLSHGIRSGAVKPLVRQVFGPDQVETAFRFMASGKHIGKVLLRMRDEETDGTLRAGPVVVKPVPRPVEALPRFFCDPSKSYIIVGGLGGFGLELADWLVLRGCRKLVLVSRSGVTKGYQAYRIKTWEGYGASVMISRAEVSCEQGCITLFEMATRKLGPVAAIFNLAVVLRDAVFENLTVEDFAVAFMPKARTTTMLDKVSRRLCPELNHFVVFSSVSCGRGNAGQANYGFANAIMERICEERRAEGLPGLAIQWGAVGDVGLVAEQMPVKKVKGDNVEGPEEVDEKMERALSGAEPMVISGTLQQRIVSCLAALDTFLTLAEPPAVVSSMVVAEKASRGSGSGSVVDTVVNILGIKDLKTVSLHSTLAELGMDSMMAVEIKQTLEREFDMFLSPQDIRGLTFARLQELAQAIQEQYRAKKEAENAVEQQDNQWLIGGLQHLLGVVGSEEGAAEAVVKLTSERIEGPRTVFMVPGVEGLAWVMEPLAKQLSYPVCCLQLPLNASSHEIPDLVQILLERLQSTQGTGPYLLLGYSYGTVLLLEMAWELQHQGHDVRVALIDGSIEALQGIARRDLELNTASEADWQSSFLEKLLIIIGCADAQEVGKALLEMPDWEARLTHTASFFPDDKKREFHKSCVNAVQKRVDALMRYSWPTGRKLKVPVTLVRTAAKMAGAPDDYGLNQICEKKVSVHVVEGTHTGIVTSKRTADIINQEAFL